MNFRTAGLGAVVLLVAADPGPTRVGTAHHGAHCGLEALSSGGGSRHDLCADRAQRPGPAGHHLGAYLLPQSTGAELDGVLVLLAPGGRTVEMHCVTGTQDEPGICEIPGDPVRGSLAEYSAVAEFAGADGGGEEPLMLRSGNNSPVYGGR